MPSPPSISSVSTEQGYSMHPQAKQIWNSPQGVSLLKAMMQAKAPTPQQEDTLAQLKQADPPKQQAKMDK
jgi:hypothetical protein